MLWLKYLTFHLREPLTPQFVRERVNVNVAYDDIIYVLILAFLILEKESANISELAYKSFLLLCLDYDLWPTSLIHILIPEDLALLNCQSKKSLLKLLFTLKPMPRLIFK